MSWIVTYSGRCVDPLDIRPKDIEAVDIAHALANICRFNGHCRAFYSVAQHSLLVADNVPARYRKAALLHDAAEAYLADLTTPVKRRMPGYREAEDKVLQAMATRFCIYWPNYSDVIHGADLRALATEKRDLMPENGPAWEILEGVEPFGPRVLPLGPGEAKTLYMQALIEEDL